MINPQWLELPMSRTIFYGPKDVRAIEVRLYLFLISFFFCFAKKNAFQMYHLLIVFSENLNKNINNKMSSTATVIK